MIGRLRERVTDWLSKSALTPWRAGLVAAGLALVPFLVTAAWTFPLDSDVLTNTVTSQQIGLTGSPVAPGFAFATEEPFEGDFGAFRNGPRGAVSKYPPGPAYFAAPVYALLQLPAEPIELAVNSAPDVGWVPVPLAPVWPAALVAATASAAAIGFLAYSFAGTGQRPDLVVLSALGLALGTSIWSVASRQLWSHTTAILGISAGIALASRRSYWLAGLGFGLAVASRPHAAVIAAIVGVALAVHERSWRPVVGVGAGSLLGLASVFLYNQVFLGAGGVSPGYGRDYLGLLVSPDLGFFATNLVGGLLSPRWGVLWWSAFLVIPLLWIRSGWRESPVWVRAAGIGGLAFLLVQFAVHRYNPANATAYRYPLEAIVAAAPLLYVAWTRAARSPIVVKAAILFLVSSAALQTFRAY